MSISTAKLIDVVQHALYGEESKKLNTSLIDSLPFPDLLRDKTEDDLKNVIIPSKETIDMFLDLVKQGRIPNRVFAHLHPLIAIWTKQHG